MNNAKDIVELIEDGTYVVEHGDYQRIANLTKKEDGCSFTADYVRKVLKGMRKNKVIQQKSKLYFKKKYQLLKALKPT